MLERAKSLTVHPAVTYSIGDLDKIELEKDLYDLVYRSLAFHYLQNLKELFRQVYDGLKAGGHFVFSVEHPIFTAPIIAPAWTESAGRTAAWAAD